jgi:hypothetical protein
MYPLETIFSLGFSILEICFKTVSIFQKHLQVLLT